MRTDILEQAKAIRASMDAAAVILIIVFIRSCTTNRRQKRPASIVHGRRI